jgi:hypothetical protein
VDSFSLVRMRRRSGCDVRLESLKNLGAFILGLAFLVLIGLIVGAILNGLVWLVDKLYPIAVLIAVVATALLVFLLAPSALLKQNRRWSGIGMYYVSYAWGVSLWMWATLALYSLWGTFGLVLGLVLLGVGSVPMACVALLFNGEWSALAQMVLGVILVFALRSFGLWVASKGRPRIQEEYYM